MNHTISRLDNLTPELIKQIQALCALCEDYEPYYDSDYDDNECFAYIGAFDDTGNLVGFIGGLILDDTIEITGLVHPNYQKQGIFKNMLSKLKEYCRGITILGTIPNDWCNVLLGSSIAPKYAYSELLMKLEQGDASHSSARLPDKETCDISSKSAEYVFPKDYANSAEYMFSEDYANFLMYLQDEDEPVAVCNLDYEDTFTNISGVYVDENMRKRGIGSIFMNELVSAYFDEYDTPLILHVSSTNVPAIKLYEKCGFKTVQCIKYYTFY